MDRFSELVRVLFFLIVYGVSYSTQVLYPYGPTAGDVQLRTAYSIASEGIPLRVPVKFYNDTYDTIFVNGNGLLSFNNEMPAFTNSPFPLDYPAMAAFYANIDPRGSGQVFYRETGDPRTLSQATGLVGRFFPRLRGRYTATSVFVATWYEVGYYKKNADRTNTFQVAIISDGRESFVQFIYPSPIQWVQSNSELTNTGLETKAQAGFSAADGRIYMLRGSGSDQIRNLDRWSNTDAPGVWLYRVGDIGTNQNVEPPEFVGGARPDVGLTCAVTGSLCHNQASCVDYDQGDMCCICKQGYFGNGVTCIKEGIPVRVGGKVSIDVNGIIVPEADLQSYVATLDGRVYMAISGVPTSLGFEMQYLSVFPSVVAWLFSLHSENAYNGYQLTGGVVNYTSELTFPGTEHRITIHQRFFGLNSFDQLTMDATIQGTTPSVPLPHTRFTLPNDNQQQYTITNGRMHSYYTYRYKQEGSDFEQQVTAAQKFEFAQPCNKATKGFSSFLLQNSKAFTYYEEKVNILRLVSTNNIFLPFEDVQDPCNDGQTKCVANSTCVREGSTFRCECNFGFRELYGSGSGCIDINECQERSDRCDPNAMCVNEVGAYSCQCKPGFEGNGYYCGAVAPVASNSEPSPPRIVENSVCDVPNNISTCSCIQGYEIRLLSADSTDFECVDVNECNTVEVCHMNGYCTNYPGSYSCSCNPGYVGNGLKCLPLPPRCRSGGRGILGCPVVKACSTGSCTCPSTYTDVGTHCVPPPDDGSTDAVDDTTTQETSISCAEINTCHAHAQCIFVASQQQHRCQCNPGYEGDGYECSIIEFSCEKSNICDIHASCQQGEGGHSMCVCHSGYEGDGTRCTQTGECEPNCGLNERCTYNETSYIYSCACLDGYQKYENKCQRSPRCQYECHKYASCVQNNMCRCISGYQGNGVTQCERIVEPGCTENSCPTNAECMYNLSGHYSCQCRQGFTGNGYNCKEIKKTAKEDIYLLVNQGMATLHISTVPNKTKLGHPVHLQFYQIAIGIAVDCLEGQLYWSDITGQTIKSAKLDGSMVQEFIVTDAKSTEGLALDWVNRKIYWTDSGLKRVMVADLSNGTHITTIANSSLSNPRGIAVHPNRKKLFWSDWNRNSPKIEWSDLDGSRREIFVQGPNVKLPNSLAIDWYTDEICWADAGLKSIECIGIDSRLQRTAVANCSYPFGLTITQDNYYWTDWISEKIEYIGRYEKVKKEHLPVPLVSNGKLYGITAVTGKCP
ncbi:Hypothetical protein CINCED_3A019659 [Cinara cedri]|nr:Hypothetical protein CINCED_3A019659 [Cinara cedri]